MKRDYELELYKSEIEKLKLELELERSNSKMPDNVRSDIAELVDVMGEMRNILEACRYERLNITLSKKIDYVLNRCKYLD